MASVSLLSRDVCISHVKTQRLPGYMIRHFQPMSLVLGSNGIDVGSLAEYVDMFQIYISIYIYLFMYLFMYLCIYISC